MTNTAFSSGIAAYWPLLLVGVCGVVLLIIAVLALLLIKGSTELPATWKLMHAVIEKKEQEKKEIPEYKTISVQFFRIGRDGEAKEVLLQPDKWILVGSGEHADFCLEKDDHKLAEKHFRICIKRGLMSVASLEQETFVNGVPIRKLGVVQICSGDLIRAGSHEYRVVFSPGEEKENAT